MVGLLTALATCCWLSLCLLDLLAYWPEADRVVSPLISGLILLISLIRLLWRRCCLSMQAFSKDSGPEFRQELMNRGSLKGCHLAEGFLTF